MGYTSTDGSHAKFLRDIRIFAPRTQGRFRFPSMNWNALDNARYKPTAFSQPPFFSGKYQAGPGAKVMTG